MRVGKSWVVTSSPKKTVVRLGNLWDSEREGGSGLRVWVDLVERVFAEQSVIRPPSSHSLFGPPSSVWTPRYDFPSESQGKSRRSASFHPIHCNLGNVKPPRVRAICRNARLNDMGMGARFQSCPTETSNMFLIRWSRVQGRNRTRSWQR